MTLLQHIPNCAKNDIRRKVEIQLLKKSRKAIIKKVWENCPKGQAYQSTIANYVSGKKCPVCTVKRIIDGINDLITLKPRLAQEWNYAKNSNLIPSQISSNSHIKHGVYVKTGMNEKCKSKVEVQAVAVRYVQKKQNWE